MNQLMVVDDSSDSSYAELKSPGLVILFPITRTGEQAEKKWLQIVHLCNQSKIAGLVVIDKTPNNDALKFFSSQRFERSHSVWILIRPSTEPIYDSQKYVKIPQDSWIIQLHDDDDWNGSLGLPDHDQTLMAFQVQFFVGSKSQHTNSKIYDELPARVNFTLIPSVIWNRFTSFIESQSGHIAGSADATLNMVVRDVCLFSTFLDFSYYYNIRHWNNDRSGKTHLTDLSREDGWEHFSSPEIAVINRTVDNLAALSYFSSLYDKEKLSAGVLRELKSFEVIRLKRVFMRYQFGLSKFGFKKNRSEFLMQLLNASEIKTIPDVIEWVRMIPQLPLLESRKIFWVEELSKLQGLIEVV
jgi:hypothetical protein